MGAAGSWAPRRLGLPAPSRPAWLAGAALGLAAAALGTVAWRRARSRRRGRLRQVGTVAQLWIYPVKSCKGVRVSAAECTALGLRCGHLRDRFWLVIKEDGHMVTARQEPRLVLVSITCEGECLMLKAPGMDQLVLPSKLPPSNKVHDCRLFGMDIKGRDCGDEAAQWFTSFLKTEAFRLVQFEKHMKGRPSKEIFSPVVPNYQVAYPDCSPIMILSEASLADLNTRLEKKVKMDQFRPNIVVTGCDAFEEDTWDELLIGNVEMKKVLSCPRCILTTVDPDTGIIDRKEPLETLKSYRLCDPSEKQIYKSSPLFGIYYSVEKIGSLQVGDPVYRMVP
ncbi:mitochondrial amidoxime reducing component 2 isoform X1 [Canis lupus baileyi]|uniref:Mitochondrial amidoxime reducing component 2 n=2 Tax=Canis lupus familiaris TaxID=9615 RepID=A0A8C0YZG4_CANLF|nr:mitochondrial amidoxime reducing component 2-like isoform X1 [Canis lupus dingo]XP_025276747.1 mitochondrial amidoxime reducing component 2-like isoform X1 [Canis lupus dingo]XP_038304404.1 mitochondrial amidoxime reducing component 2 isoform X1 [Canis lupus familiaris]XP_038304405.1 mitochondrial amidoxime reducing component 2 isoform X1 [Canis lupus familiaris]XP_038319931.1 mitochondrial amidoxime reducing component 2 isoform X1 [Canis lupus familiaris]XP_038319932.1 mitochondrial amidox